ncbi:hypothetical protein BH23CHL8_BH23CHL8_10640 [soil metagenome]
MSDPVLPTIEFSPAKARLSDVMTDVYHGHRPMLVSRHRGKERMLLVRPDDLAALLGPVRFDVEVVHDADEVSVALPALELFGIGDTIEEAREDLLVELRAYAARYLADPVRYLRAGRGEHAAALLAFALADERRQGEMLHGGDQDMASPRLAVAG